MTVHLCRDLLTLNTANNTSQRVPAYLLALFLRRVLKYSFVGCTGLKIQTTGESGAHLLATGDSTPTTATGTWSSGDMAAINLGSGLEYRISVPSGTYAVQSSDLNRLLVLRSTANPKHNSGIFRITNVDLVNNRWTIDYRSGEFPPVEAAGSLEWYLYKSDTEVTFPTTGSAQPYTGWGAGANYRIILQSPHAAAWQVRICGEPIADVAASRVTAMTFAPGFDGDANGDFVVGGKHTHFLHWANVASTDYCTAAGLFIDTAAGTSRVTILGDDTGQAVFMAVRAGTGTQHGGALFGIPDSEPLTVPTEQRIFVIASNAGGFNSSENAHSWFVDLVGGSTRHAAGQALNMSITPCAAGWGAWCYLTGNTAMVNPGADTNAADSIWGLATELLTVDVLAGFWRGTWNSTSAVLPMIPEPRVMGTAPYVRQGRTNFGDYTLSSDGAWYHLKNGTYMQWAGPAVVP